MIVRVEHDRSLLGILCTCLEYAPALSNTRGACHWWRIRFAGQRHRCAKGTLVREGYIRDAQLRPINAPLLGSDHARDTLA